MVELTRLETIIVANLRERFGDKIAHLHDRELADDYEAFEFSDMSGDNDARFLLWLGIEE